MENLISVTGQQSVTKSKTSWLARENKILTTIMEGKPVTNAKMLSFGHGMIAGYILLRSATETTDYAAMGMCLLWFILSLAICLKIKH